MRIEGDGEVDALYDRWAATYDTDQNRTRDLAGRVLRTESADLVAGDVVELGCGTGRNTVWLVERARSLTGVDFSTAMLEEARRKISDDRVRFVRHDIRAALPLLGDSADLVVITLVLEHIEDLGFVFGECARVLRPGGYLWACELHPSRQWKGGQAQFVAPGEREAVRVPAYVHEVSEYVNAAIAADLRIVQMGEWRDDRNRAEASPPRLLSVLYRCPSREELDG